MPRVSKKKKENLQLKSSALNRFFGETGLRRDGDLRLDGSAWIRVAVRRSASKRSHRIVVYRKQWGSKHKNHIQSPGNDANQWTT